MLAIFGALLGSRRGDKKSVHISAHRASAGRGADAPDVIDATDTYCSDDEQ